MSYASEITSASQAIELRGKAVIVSFIESRMSWRTNAKPPDVADDSGIGEPSFVGMVVVEASRKEVGDVD